MRGCYHSVCDHRAGHAKPPVWPCDLPRPPESDDRDVVHDGEAGRNTSIAVDANDAEGRDAPAIVVAVAEGRSELGKGIISIVTSGVPAMRCGASPPSVGDHCNGIGTEARCGMPARPPERCDPSTPKTVGKMSSNQPDEVRRGAMPRPPEILMLPKDRSGHNEKFPSRAAA